MALLKIICMHVLVGDMNMHNLVFYLCAEPPPRIDFLSCKGWMCCAEAVGLLEIVNAGETGGYATVVFNSDDQRSIEPITSICEVGTNIGCGHTRPR